MCSLLVLLSVVHAPGQTTFDTKLDLTTSPGSFLERSLRLWNPQASFGELQNQAYGYLFPQGSFFWLGDLLSLPDWLVQRLWSAALLVAAYEGCRRVFRALCPDTPRVAHVVAGLGYALAPRLLGLDGVLTGEVLPTAVLPWVVLPLVLTRLGRLSVRTGALLSGVAVLFMGGVNAVENLATFPLPLFVVLAGIRSAAGRSLLRWWSGAMALACLWWMLPLLVLGRYSPAFLDYIETSEATTKYLGWTNAVRGADHWVGFVAVGGRPWWPAMYYLSTSSVAIVVTAAVAALGLAALVRRDMALRGPLLASVLLGLLCLTLGHGGALGSPLAGLTRDLLDGPLAPLRNVHKVDPLVRLPLALGLAHLVAVTRGRRWTARVPGWPQSVSARSVTVLPILAAVVIGLLAVSATPLVSGDMRKPGYRDIPDAWYQAARYVEEHHGEGRVLILPGSGFAEQTWGSTIDEPLQGISDVPWVSRTQVPLAPGPTIRFLDAIEQRILDGSGSPALAPLLARAGVSLVLVRRDLDLTVSDAPSPPRVDAAIAASPGLTSVATFGTAAFGVRSQVEVYRVDAIPEGLDDLRVDAVEADEAPVLAGDAGDVAALVESGLVDARRPVLLDPTRAPTYQTDGYRRIERQFGRVHDAVSSLMSTADPARVNKRVLDYPGPPGQQRVTRFHDGVASMTASSSAGFADTLGPAVPERGPYAAVDGSVRSFWQSAPSRRPVGAWLELRLREPLPVAQVTVATGGVARGVPVREVEVTAGGRTVSGDVDPNTGRAVLQLPGEVVDRLRVTVTEVGGAPASGAVAINEVRVPGLATTETTALPDQGADGATSFVFSARPPRPACAHTELGPVCDVFAARQGEAQVAMSRRIDLGSDGVWNVRGSVVASGGRAARVLTEPLGGAVRVRSRSVYSDDLLVAPQRAFDDDPGTWWLASPGEESPTLRLRWDEPRTLRRLAVVTAPNAASAPVAVLTTPSGEQRTVGVDGSSPGFFEPLRTNRLDITFQRTGLVGTADPIGVAELLVDGLEDLRYRHDPESPTGTICGIGPPLRVDGVVVPTRVEGTVEELERGLPMDLVSCGGQLPLDAGRHRIEVVATSQFVPTSLVLASAAQGVEDHQVDTRETSIESWSSEHREVTVGPGEEALLRIPENVNDGWRATLDGTVLEKRTIDGWQQGYVVPAGEGGVVELEYTPGRWFRAALLAGLLGALVLGLGCAASVVADRRRPAARHAPIAPAGQDSGHRDPDPWWPGRPALRLVLLAGFVAAALVLGGIGVALGLAVALGVRREPVLGVLVGGLVGLAGVVAALPDLPDLVSGVPDLAAAVAVGIVLGLAPGRLPRVSVPGLRRRRAREVAGG